MNEEAWLKLRDPEAMYQYVRNSMTRRKTFFYTMALCRSAAALLPGTADMDELFSLAEKALDAEDGNRADSAWYDATTAFHTSCVDAGDASARLSSWLVRYAGGAATLPELHYVTVHLHSVTCDAHQWARWGLPGAFPGETGTTVRPWSRSRQARWCADHFGHFFRGRTLPKCERCDGTGFLGKYRYGPTCTGCSGLGVLPLARAPWEEDAGVKDLALAAYEERLPDKQLDPLRLAILADAMEEAGCREDKLLAKLRNASVPSYRGFWPLDSVLGK